MGRHFCKPWVVVVIGVAVLFVGFVYDAVFAGIPYQDPTPELAAAYAFHSDVASAIRWVGVALVLLGSALGLVRRLRADRPL